MIKVFKAWEAKIRYKSGCFSILVGRNVFTSVLADFKKYLLLMERLYFWTGYVQNIVKVKKKFEE